MYDKYTLLHLNFLHKIKLIMRNSGALHLAEPSEAAPALGLHGFAAQLDPVRAALVPLSAPPVPNVQQRLRRNSHPPGGAARNIPRQSSNFQYVVQTN